MHTKHKEKINSGPLFVLMVWAFDPTLEFSAGKVRELWSEELENSSSQFRVIHACHVKLCFIYLSEKLGDFYIHAFCRVRGQWE
uniref:Uncharacterized protein n=1 Tax=Helianthus annuus TaxID=4232 RepID=A0A251SPQ8_HELAN